MHTSTLPSVCDGRKFHGRGKKFTLTDKNISVSNGYVFMLLWVTTNLIEWNKYSCIHFCVCFKKVEERLSCLLSILNHQISSFGLIY